MQIILSIIDRGNNSYIIHFSIRRIILFIPILLISMMLSGQETNDYEEAKAETLEAMKAGETFPVSITIYDQYRID